MLIINADDLGRDALATDAAVACHARGRITSASAMVFMADSERAARLAIDARIPTGLHLNLSERFSAANVPAATRASHERLCRFFSRGRYAVVLYHPLLAPAFRDAVDAQLREFARLFGRFPAHVDGHHHLHLATNILLQRLLPEGARVRRSFTFAAGQKHALNLWYRRRVDGLLQRRHVLTDHFFSLSHHLSHEAMAELAALATQADVEVMTHPAWPREYDFLMSDEFAAALAR